MPGTPSLPGGAASPAVLAPGPPAPRRRHRSWDQPSMRALSNHHHNRLVEERERERDHLLRLFLI